ncbi:MAG: FAD:protein FMN transferase, partial [Pseudomonadota bacterium]
MIIDRRRFISITAASAVFPGAASSGTLHRQTGRALGAATSMQLANTSADKARDAFAIVEAELSRLERVFSLYDPGSELSRLNANGYLAAAAPELVSVLSLCAGLHHATDGAFDPTVQPLWAHHAGLSKGSRPQDLVGWDMVTVTRDDIRFAKPGMQLTLNGIAQGYITDQIAALLRRRGFRQVLIDMGEIAAIG